MVIWSVGDREISSYKWPESDMQSSSAGTGGLQIHVGQPVVDGVVSSELLLPLWQRCGHYGIQICHAG